MAFEIQVPALHPHRDMHQGFRRTHHLKASFILVCGHHVSSYVNRPVSFVGKQIMGKKACTVLKFCDIPALVGPHQCNLQYFGTEEKSYWKKF